jgi:tellurite resistance protein TerC
VAGTRFAPGPQSLEFLSGYPVERSPAVDNIFVFLMIFTCFAVAGEYRKRAPMIGIVGAIVLRSSRYRCWSRWAWWSPFSASRCG